MGVGTKNLKGSDSLLWDSIGALIEILCGAWNSNLAIGIIGALEVVGFPSVTVEIKVELRGGDARVSGTAEVASDAEDTRVSFFVGVDIEVC